MCKHIIDLTSKFMRMVNNIVIIVVVVTDSWVPDETSCMDKFTLLHFYRV